MSREKERLLARKEKIQQRLADIEKAEARRREKDEQRKAELAGRAVLKHARKDAEFAGRLRVVLDSEITGARTRALFGLPPGRTAASGKSGTRDQGVTGQLETKAAAPPDSAAAD